MPNIIFSGDVPNNTPPPLPQGGTPGDGTVTIAKLSQGVRDSLESITAVSIATFGAVGTDFTAATGPDCTDALLQHVEKNYSDGVQRPLLFPPGKRYHFNTADPLSLLAARNPTLSADQVWDMTSNLMLLGAFPQHEAQGREAAGVKHPTEIHVHTTGNSDVWIKKHRRADSVKVRQLVDQESYFRPSR